MKAINIITHPVTLIICFLLVMVSGQHFGGFYLLYILLALPHGSVHSVLAVAGITILLFSNYKYKRQFSFKIEPLLNITGVLMLLFSLYLFFYNDKGHYNYGTFYQIVPIISLVGFVLMCVVFSINNLGKLFRQVDHNRHN